MEDYHKNQRHHEDEGRAPQEKHKAHEGNRHNEHEAHHRHDHHGHKAHEPHHAPHKTNRKKEEFFSTQLLVLVTLSVLLVGFNQVQINSISAMTGSSIIKHKSSSTSMLGGDLDSVDVNSLQSTAQTLAAVFPLGDGTTGDEIMSVMFPTGTPEYGVDLDVTFDDPVNSLATLAKMYRSLKTEVESSDPEAFARFIELASQPKGVSCEYCCGIGPTGADSKGNSKCGCQHNPALLSVALYLSAYSDYTDAEILRETMRWKTLFFPKNMIELGSSIAGGDSSVLENLPGMVGGC